MSEKADFMSLALNGQVLIDEIDDFVDAWHDGDSDLELSEFLGMTLEEYSLWASDGSMIDLILLARKNAISIKKAVNDNIAASNRLAARAGDARRIARLQKWIDAQPDRH